MPYLCFIDGRVLHAFAFRHQPAVDDVHRTVVSLSYGWGVGSVLFLFLEMLRLFSGVTIVFEDATERSHPPGSGTAIVT